MQTSMNNSIRSQSLLDREVNMLSSSVRSLPPTRATKSECPFSVEIEAKDGSSEHVRLSSRSWSFSVPSQKQATLWEHPKMDSHPSSNSVELIPVNSSSESEDSFSLEDEEEHIIVLLDDEDWEEGGSLVSPHVHNPLVLTAESHPLSTAIERNQSMVSEQQQQQQPETIVCAYDCFADHITNIFCPVERQHIETTSHKSLPLEESSASMASSHPTPGTNNNSVCDPEGLQFKLFPPPSETAQDPDRSSFLFSSLNFWDIPGEEAERSRRLRALEQQELQTPRNRSRHSKKHRDRYLQHLLDTWHPPVQEDEQVTAFPRSNDNSTRSAMSRKLKRSKSVSCRSKRKVPLSSDDQLCYDSDPEKLFSGKRERAFSIRQESRRGSGGSVSFQSSAPLIRGEVKENNASGDITSNSHHSAASSLSISTAGNCSTSYETANNNDVVQPPLAPRHGDRISFDFVTTDKTRSQSGGEATVEEMRFQCRDGCTSSVDDEVDLDCRPTSALSSPETDVSHTASSSSEEKELEETSSTRRRSLHSMHMPLPARCEPPFFQVPTQWTEFHLLYSTVDDFSKAHVQELSNVRFPLIWHPPVNKRKPARSSCETKSPLACHGVFEVGAHLDHMVVQPKFTWSPVLQPSLDEERKILLSGSQPHAVELLSIIRVNTPSLGQRPSLTGSGWDRSLYPFCRLDRTVCVTTNDVNHPYLVFEARSTMERDWLVVALKLIVARLASIIIVRDEDMLLEFFSPYSALLNLEDEEESDDEGEIVVRGQSVVSGRDALDTLTLGKKPNRSPIEASSRDEHGGDRQDISLDDGEDNDEE